MASSRVCRALGAGGYSSRSAANALEGIAVAQNEDLDLVIVQGPFTDLDAYAVTLRLRALPGWEDRPIVLVENEDDAQMALAVGATGRIAAPAQPARLVRDITRYLGGQREHADQSSEIRLRALSQRLATDLESQLHELRRANEELQYLVRGRSEFLRNVGHELATPITPAVGFVEMLRTGRLGPVTPLQREALDQVAQALDRLNHTTGVLREVSAFESGNFRIRNLHFTLGQLADRIRTSLLARGVETSVLPQFHVGRPAAALKGDMVLLSRSLEHVLGNAHKFSEDGSAIALSLQIEGDEVVATVVDDGPGISPSNRERLGGLFHQGDGSATRKHGGVGLGLAYARRVAEAHGGGIEVHSPPVSLVGGMTWTGTEVTLRWKCRPKVPSHPSNP